MRFWLLALAVLALSNCQRGPAKLACAPLPGAEAVLARPEGDVVVVGVKHGSAEPPAVFLALACAAVARRERVLIALDRSSAGQPALAAFLDSDGGEKALAALFSGDPGWLDATQDGRSSRAMLALLQTLRVWKKAGAEVSVAAIAPPTAEPRPGARDAAMAAALEAARAAEAPARTFVLVDALSASTGPWGLSGETWDPMAARLPAAQRLSLSIESEGGEAWSCAKDACAAAPIAASDFAAFDGKGARVKLVGTEIVPPIGAPRVHDGVIQIGPVTASPPAAR
jgi:hypothetical protein